MTMSFIKGCRVATKFSFEIKKYQLLSQGTFGNVYTEDDDSDLVYKIVKFQEKKGDEKSR